MCVCPRLMPLRNVVLLLDDVFEQVINGCAAAKRTVWNCAQQRRSMVQLLKGICDALL